MNLTHLPWIRMSAGTGYYYFTLVVNIIGLVMGFLMIFDPLLSVFSSSLLIGFYLTLTGVEHVVLAVSKIGMSRE